MNYYLVIYNHISELVEAHTPELAVIVSMEGERWHARNGKVSGHFVVHEFYVDGRATGREIDVVDLGPAKDVPLVGVTPDGQQVVALGTNAEDLPQPSVPHTCGKCGASSQGPHACPYQAALHNNNDLEYCTCCKACTRRCRNDI